MYIIHSSLIPVDSSESSGESVSGFSSSSHSYQSALEREVEDTSLVCASLVTGGGASVDRQTEATAALHKPNAQVGSQEKTRPPVPPKPKLQQAKDVPCAKVQCKDLNQ